MPATESLPIALAAVAVHMAAMLVVTGIVALAVYEWFGLAFLRRGWINVDLHLDGRADRHRADPDRLAMACPSARREIASLPPQRAATLRQTSLSETHPMARALVLERQHELALRDIDLPVDRRAGAT